MIKKPINLKKLYGSEYKITLDEAAYGKKTDPYYYQIDCKYGHFYPHSSKLIGYFCDSGNIMAKLHRDHPTIKLLECDGEGIFYFTKNQFETVSEYARPKRKRGRKKLPESEKQKLLTSGKVYRFSTGKKGSTEAKVESK